MGRCYRLIITASYGRSLRGKGSTRKAKTKNRKKKDKGDEEKERKDGGKGQGSEGACQGLAAPRASGREDDFSKTVTFEEVAKRMRAGEDFYDICDCNESVQREYCFARMAELFGTNYEYWYRTWLEGKPPKSLKPREPKRMIGNCILITRITK